MPPKEKKSEYSMKSEAPVVGYVPKRFEIPTRYSSLYHSHATVEDRERLQTLEDKSSQLKRKASELSAKSAEFGVLHHSTSMEFITTRHELINNSMQTYATLLAGYKSAREAGEITEEEYADLVETCWNKRAKLADEGLVLTRDSKKIMAALDKKDGPDLEGAYTALFTQIFKHEERPAEWEARKNYRVELEDGHFANESTWRRDVRQTYNAHHPETSGDLWCPITQQYDDGSLYRTTAHIVPHALGYPLVGSIFGEPDNGRDLVWSMKNAMVMDSAVEKQFDKGSFVLLPLEPKPDQPQEWQVYVLNKGILKQKLRLSGLTWQDLHKRTLVWKNDCRPGHRFLYYHFVANMMRFKRFEKPSWKEHLIELPTGSIWATPGQYLRKSMLKVLGEAIGDVYEMPSGLYWEGTFGGAEEMSNTEKEEIKRKMLVSQEKPDTLADLEEEDNNPHRDA